MENCRNPGCSCGRVPEVRICDKRHRHGRERHMEDRDRIHGGQRLHHREERAWNNDFQAQKHGKQTLKDV